MVKIVWCGRCVLHDIVRLNSIQIIVTNLHDSSKTAYFVIEYAGWFFRLFVMRSGDLSVNGHPTIRTPQHRPVGTQRNEVHAVVSQERLCGVKFYSHSGHHV